MSGQAPAGWYPDPSGQPRVERWWDGQRWSTTTRDVVAAPVPDVSARTAGGQQTAGVWTYGVQPAQATVSVGAPGQGAAAFGPAAAGSVASTFGSPSQGTPAYGASASRIGTFGDAAAGGAFGSQVGTFGGMPLGSAPATGLSTYVDDEPRTLRRGVVLGLFLVALLVGAGAFVAGRATAAPSAAPAATSTVTATVTAAATVTAPAPVVDKVGDAGAAQGLAAIRKAVPKWSSSPDIVVADEAIMLCDTFNAMPAAAGQLNDFIAGFASTSGLTRTQSAALLNAASAWKCPGALDRFK